MEQRYLGSHWLIASGFDPWLGANRGELFRRLVPWQSNIAIVGSIPAPDWPTVVKCGVVATQPMAIVESHPTI